MKYIFFTIGCGILVMAITIWVLTGTTNEPLIAMGLTFIASTISYEKRKDICNTLSQNWSKIGDAQCIKQPTLQELETQSLRMEQQAGIFFDKSGFLLPGYYRRTQIQVPTDHQSIPIDVLIRNSDNKVFTVSGKPFKFPELTLKANTPQSSQEYTRDAQARLMYNYRISPHHLD